MSLFLNREFSGGGRVTRRQVLAGGTAALLAGSVGGTQAQAAAVPGTIGKAKHVIHLFLHGGAATQDMFDLKPGAPAEIRGEFQPIATSAPGIEVCEHLPKTARWMHRAAVVRSVHHESGCHNCLPSFTGSEEPVDINELVPRETFPPGMGSVCEYLKPDDVDLPHYVALPTWLGWGFALKRPGPWGGFLGSRYDPLLSEYQPMLDEDPPEGRQPVYVGAPALAAMERASDVSEMRLSRRRALLSELNARTALSGRSADALEGNWRRAFSLMSQSKLKRAFDLGDEDPRTRERYGSHVFGTSTLVARRLVEAGVKFVDVYFDGYASRLSSSFDWYWDTHYHNFSQLKKANLPCFDETFDALLTDLDDRGLLDETLILVNSDFGRTPRVNASAGRDHWTHCYSVLFAGGGIRGGTVCGASDAHAAYVKNRPVRPADVCATVFECLGIDPETLVYDRTRRPLPIANGGEAIHEILA